ncbi:metal-dependent hydrolase [Actinocorallia sp. API 0066]|uniref:metal-dependent hydrolase n=1 Tax=Actinocorallia sp. API 0066 TaxID=2896846 RepID=UPI001E4EC0DD|nr:metal-dependent hydrolase [Actinocorallia sp. API 0066]MCD0450036.1 metal-dependent hydrolase [Actinocorallia sp. API 0066]
MLKETPPPDNLVLGARDVRFDWSELPRHWVPDEPLATHLMNVLHLLLPAGERWFVEVFKQALPLIHDDDLRRDVLGFIGQEAMHAGAHQGVLDHFAAHGMDCGPFVDQVDWLFSRVMGDRPHLEGRRQTEWLVSRLAVIAAIEHVTAFMGDWILNADGLDAARTDPTMLDLLRWHGAEEVEHRSVAFNLYQHVDGRYLRRIQAMAMVAPMMFVLWRRGVRFMYAVDTELAGHRPPRVRDVRGTAARGVTPSLPHLTRKVLKYFARGYHPSQEGDTDQAVAYLASSPSARAAAERAA